MLVEVSSDHLAELRPLRKCDAGTVYSDLSAGEKQHGIEVVQILRIVFELLFRQGFSIGADGCLPQTRLFAQSLNRRHGVRDRLVPLALLFTNHQEAFFRRVSGLTWARIAACRKDNECEAEE